MSVEPLLRVGNLRTYFNTDEGVVKAVDGVSFEVAPGERVAIVGESGSGKTVTALSILQLVERPAGRILDGSRIIFKGRDLLTLTNNELEEVRGNEIAMVFQDPLTALNPVFTIGFQIEEAIRMHRDVSKRERHRVAVELLHQMDIPDPATTIYRYPHELSGGMRQRAMIAMALSCDPDLLIADEPTTALDVTIQAQIMELLRRVVEERNLAVLLITHDLGVVAGFSQRILVMYAGRVVEEAVTDEIFYRSAHPYTYGLLGSLARLDKEPTSRLYSIRGAPPSMINLPAGCRFHPRCSFNDGDTCEAVEPELKIRDGIGHRSACHYAGKLILTADRPTLERQKIGP